MPTTLTPLTFILTIDRVGNVELWRDWTSAATSFIDADMRNIEAYEITRDQNAVQHLEWLASEIARERDEEAALDREHETIERAMMRGGITI